MTTNISHLREKLGTPEGEYELLDTSNVPTSEKDAERLDDNDTIIEEIILSEKEEYVVGAKKSADKKSELRRKLSRHHGNKIKRFTKKSGA